MENPDDCHNRQGRERFGALGLGVRAPSAHDWARDCAQHGSQYAIVVGTGGDVLGLEHRWAERAQAVENDHHEPSARLALSGNDAANDRRIAN